MVKGDTAIIYQKEYDDFKMKYGEIVKESVVTQGYDAILDEVWNVCTINKVPDPK